ncbi:MAG: mechanosensitive ion channel family protein [Candidatus Micrarchaeota archaeon]|nr:mechanosensitive ion channel family protein [Candidatus Micrarchaeota archaeon]
MGRHHIYLFYFVLVLVAGAVLTIFSLSLLNYLNLDTTVYNKVAQAVITVVFGLAAVRLLAASILAYGKHRPRLDEGPLARLTCLMGYVIILFLVLSIFQINLTGALIGAGFLGIVVGLASQSTLGNMFAGITMMAAKPFAIGDSITFSTSQYGILPPSYTHRAIRPGYTGVIREIGLMYTKVKLEDGTALFVPNNSMSQAIIINYAISDIIEVDVRVELPLGTSFESFKERALKEIRRHERLMSATKGRVEIHITDINSSNYGVDFKAKCTVENKTYVRGELSNITLKIVADISDKPQARRSSTKK